MDAALGIDQKRSWARSGRHYLQLGRNRPSPDLVQRVVRAGVLAVAASVLLIAGCGDTSTQADSSTGVPDPVVGTVVAGPTCPVERVESPCPPRPVVAGTVDLLRAGRVVQRTRTDASGHFRLAAAAGVYQLRAINAGGYHSVVEQAVVVSATTPPVTLALDTGIR